jgi:hypothetical protein
MALATDFEQLAADLVGHDTIQREIFCPACQKEMGITALLGVARPVASERVIRERHLNDGDV